MPYIYIYMHIYTHTYKSGGEHIALWFAIGTFFQGVKHTG